MNSSSRFDSYNEAFTKNFITFFLVFTIICINGAFVYTYFKSKDFQRDPRYVLYIHLVINDMIMLILSLGLVIFIYTGNPGFIPCWIMLVVLITTNRNSPLNLAVMALERYIAVCLPLHHVQICTVQRAHLLIALIWLVSFIPAFTDIIIILITQPLSVFSKTVICHATFVYNTPYHVTSVYSEDNMNSSSRFDSYNAAFTKNFIIFFLVFTIICINGAFVYTYFKSKDFQRDPRYVLYIHLVINDMIMLTLSLGLVISTYIAYPGFIPAGSCWSS
ncbi:hypothetical protein F7725_016464 [Dissostichus mawsoni]|uniref:G-protein coupled receptors family 1 profile domain-containing protein n=1 Tax=Dissostichus mawsoni TaxID=36200 RepID=A0A7J5Z3M9_DISMA|nr:hypothetical protein F7725_016464 [Dissostichus mawsoni]